MSLQPHFFATKAALRKWFLAHHRSATELLLGYYKVGTGKPSVSWPDSVDEAICVGWIDGVRRSIDEESYMIRFTPRKPASIWSTVNIAKVERLTAAGLMLPEGIAAFEKRKEHKTAIYSYENEAKELDPQYLKQFETNSSAWAYFNAQAPSYRKTAIHSIMSAKQETTRLRRFEKLLRQCVDQEKFWLQ
jgi:uncharacterized protein YdeI (YjbR/CyaY-like superfamily)